MKTNSNKKISRGDIFYVNGDKNNPPIGDEIWPDRMGLIVSADAINNSSNVVDIVFLTTSPNKRISVTHIPVKSKKKIALAMCEQIHSVDKSRLGDYINSISEEEQKDIDAAITFSMQLTTNVPHLIGMFNKWENYINKYHLSLKETSDITENIVIEQLMQERDCYKKLYETKLKLIEEMKKLMK